MLDAPMGVDNQGVAQWGNDQSIVIFFKGARRNDVKSRAEGMEVFDDIDMVRVIHPGENDGNGIETEALDIHKYRWPNQWKAYKDNTEYRQAGTPVEMLFPTSPATVQMLKAKNVFTIQQLAVLDDNVISRNPMFAGLKARAGQFLEAAKKGAGHHELVAANEKLTADLSTAQADVAEMKAQIAKLMAAQTNAPADASEDEGAPAKRGPGRPRKNPEPEIPATDGPNPYDPASY